MSDATQTQPQEPVDTYEAPYIPHRFQEKQFRKYETYINDIVNSFPLVVTYSVNGSPTTFACRLRDAMKSLSIHRWKTNINMERFDKIHPANDVARKLIKVSEIGYNVIRISPVATEVSLIRDRTVAPAKLDVVVSSTPTPTSPLEQQPVDFTSNQEQDLVLLCQLASKRLLTNPLIVTIKSEALAIKLMEDYDVLLTQFKNESPTAEIAVNKYILI